jgi:hypothetical protein
MGSGRRRVLGLAESVFRSVVSLWQAVNALISQASAVDTCCISSLLQSKVRLLLPELAYLSGRALLRELGNTATSLDVTISDQDMGVRVEGIFALVVD